jgi:hypothetical protein
VLIARIDPDGYSQLSQKNAFNLQLNRGDNTQWDTRRRSLFAKSMTLAPVGDGNTGLLTSTQFAQKEIQDEYKTGKSHSQKFG